MSVRILQGDCREVLRTLPDESVHCVVTSPPYFNLRSYLPNGHPDKGKEIGLESSPAAYVSGLVEVFREVHRVLRKDGTLWCNLADSYAGSGRGGNPEAGTKQGTNKGSQSIGVLYGREDEDKEAERQRIKDQHRELYAAGLKQKDLIGIPWSVAFALRDDGWWLRQDIILAKKNPMPESVRDRCTSSHEYFFLLTKSRNYYLDSEAIAEPAVSDHPSGNGFKRDHRLSYQNGDGTPRGRDEQWTEVGGTRNRRSVWGITTKPYKGAHFATFNPTVVELAILAGTKPGGVVLDPFAGAGTVGLVADRLGRDAILIELNPEYAAMAEDRIKNDAPLLSEVA